MSALLLILVSLIPIGVYFWREHKMDTPSLQWPVLAKILNLQYAADPPRMSGSWSKRRVAFEIRPDGVAVTAWLAAPTRLRVECGPHALVEKRAGLVVPDRVEPLDRDFREKLLARCSDKAAGPTVFDAALQQRLAGLRHVDFVGQDDRVVWNVPAVRDPDGAEGILGAIGAVADGLESFPKSGGGPSHA